MCKSIKWIAYKHYRAWARCKTGFFSLIIFKNGPHLFRDFSVLWFCSFLLWFATFFRIWYRPFSSWVLSFVPRFTFIYCSLFIVWISWVYFLFIFFLFFFLTFLLFTLFSEMHMITLFVPLHSAHMSATLTIQTIFFYWSFSISWNVFSWGVVACHFQLKSGKTSKESEKQSHH